MSEQDVIKATRPRMDTVIDDFQRKLGTVRTGRAAVSLLDSVMVDYYGTPTPLSQMASVHAPEPAMLTVQPWDQTQVAPIEKAIRAADLGLNPSNDGKLVRIPISTLCRMTRMNWRRRCRLWPGPRWDQTADKFSLMVFPVAACRRKSRSAKFASIKIRLLRKTISLRGELTF